MSDTLETELALTLKWAFRDQLDLSTVADNGRVEFGKTLVDGTAVDQADTVWHDQRTLAAGANDDLDLTALTKTVFGNTITTNFAQIKKLLLINLGTLDNLLLRVGGAPSNAWAKPFNDVVASVLDLPSGTPILLANRESNWTVTNGVNDILRIANTTGGQSISYKIVIVGVSA